MRSRLLLLLPTLLLLSATCRGVPEPAIEQAQEPGVPATEAPAPPLIPGLSPSLLTRLPVLPGAPTAAGLDWGDQAPENPVFILVGGEEPAEQGPPRVLALPLPEAGASFGPSPRVGPYAEHAIQPLATKLLPGERPVILAPAELPLAELVRVAVTGASLGGELRVLARYDETKSTALRVLALRLPGSDTAPEDLVSGATLGELLARLQTLPESSRALATLDLGPTPCASSPQGMRCVAGSREPATATFWVDEADVTVSQLAACRASGVCRKSTARVPADPAAPVTGLSKENARLLCGFLGRRPATAAELGRAGLQGPEHGLRCASPSPHLPTWPPRAWDGPLAATPAPLDEAGRALIHDIAEDAIEEKPPCENIRGHSTLSCKDPIHHIMSNEHRLAVVWPLLRGRGGAFLGVGSDQNYDMVAQARSEVAWFLDYDAQVVYLHRINGVFFAQAETPEAFVALWDPKRQDEALALLRADHAGKADLADLERLYRVTRSRIHKHYTETLANTNPPTEGWLRTPEHYAWIRGLWRNGRAWAVKGDMLGQRAMRAVGKATWALGVPLRIYYTSNAPDAWGGALTPDYKRNVLSFHVDALSVVVSAWGIPTGFGGPKGYWHYNLQGAPRQQRLLVLDSSRVASQLIAERLPWPPNPDLTLDDVLSVGD